MRQYAFGWQVYPPKWVKFWEHEEYEYFSRPVCKGASPYWTKTLDVSPYTKIRLLVKADYTGWDGKAGYAPTTVPVTFGD